MRNYYPIPARIPRLAPDGRLNLDVFLDCPVDQSTALVLLFPEGASLAGRRLAGLILDTSQPAVLGHAQAQGQSLLRLLQNEARLKTLSKWALSTTDAWLCHLRDGGGWQTPDGRLLGWVPIGGPATSGRICG